MAFSYEEKTGDGSTHTYTFSFDYILKAHVKLFYTRDILLDTQTATLTLGTDYNFTADKSIQLIGSTLNSGTTAGQPYNLPNGTKLMIERQTPDSSQISAWQDGSNLTAEALNNADLQNLYVVQETQDRQDLSAAKSEAAKTASDTATTNVSTLTATQVKKDGSVVFTGNLQLGTNRITGVGDPTGAQDAATKSYVDAKPGVTGSFGSTNISTSGTLAVDGNVTLGDNVNSDTLHVNAKVSTHFIGASGVSLGTSNDKWSSAYVTNAYLDSVDINGGNIDGTAIGATSPSTGAFSNLSANGTLTITAGASLNGGVDLGSGTEDRITVNGYIDSHVLPNATDFDLGSSSKKWGEVHTVSLVAGGITVNGTATIASLAGGALVDSSGHSGATVSDTTVFSTAASDARYFIQTASTDEVISSGYTTWPVDGTKDNYVATPGAIDKRITQIVDDVGGFVAIANEGSFPVAHPDPKADAGTIISITALSAERTASSSGVLTTGFTTTGGGQVTINNCPVTDGNGQVFAAGYGLLVQTTTSAHTYDFVRYVPNTSQVATVAANSTNINTVAGDTAAINNITTNLSAVQNASTNATNAASSATSSATSATNAATSATAAANSATAAANSATAAASSQTAAASSQTAAASSATAAAASESTVSTHATNAAASATTASTQATTATTQATNAATSATSAASSATTATAQAAISTTQATNAAASANTANTHKISAQGFRDATSGIFTQSQSIAYNLVDSVSSHTNWGNITDVGTAVFADESDHTQLTMAKGTATYNYGGIT